MGRNRKSLIEKSTSILFRIDNETLFKFCDKLNIKYDESAEMLEDDTKNEINEEIKKIIKNFVK